MPQLIETWTNKRLTPAQYPDEARTEALPFGPSLTVVAGQTIAVSTTTNKGAPYANAGANGTGTAKGLSVYDFTTDANGKVMLGGQAGQVVDANTALSDTAPIFIAGTFDPNDLTNFDAAAQTAMGGRVIGNGFIRIP